MAAKLLVTLLVMVFASQKSLATLNVFETGKFSAESFHVERSKYGHDSPPKPLLICSPTTNGIFPVILFLHGTCVINSDYRQLLEHIASHGYIVVAPQLYKCLPLPVCGLMELEYAAGMANWLPSGLQSALPKNVKGDINNVSIAGHSRGGKTAFALALGYANPLEVKFSALVGIDPVAGFSKDCRAEPEILNFTGHSFNLSIPVTVIGTGLGNQSSIFNCPPCAPNEVNHVEFFNECNSTGDHFVTTNYGHMDMLNDNLTSPIDKICKKGEDHKDPMRRTVGGITVAFLDYVQGKSGDYITIKNNHSVAPVKLDPPPPQFADKTTKMIENMPTTTIIETLSKPKWWCPHETFCPAASALLKCLGFSSDENFALA